MQTKNIYLRLLAVTSLALTICPNQVYGMDTAIDTRLPRDPRSNIKSHTSQNMEEIQEPSGNKKRLQSSNKRKEAVQLDTRSVLHKKQKNDGLVSISDVINKGVEDYSLPSIQEVQENFQGSGVVTDEVITKAFEGDGAAMRRIGALYLRSLDFPIAEAFLFRAAQENNPDAFWLLSTMIFNKHLESNIENLDKLLLDEAERLGSGAAKLYKQESGIF